MSRPVANEPRENKAAGLNANDHVWWALVRVGNACVCVYLPLSRAVRVREKHRTRRAAPWAKPVEYLNEGDARIYIRACASPGAAWLCGNDGDGAGTTHTAGTGTCPCGHTVGPTGKPASPHSLVTLPRTLRFVYWAPPGTLAANWEFEVGLQSIYVMDTPRVLTLAMLSFLSGGRWFCTSF